MKSQTATTPGRGLWAVLPPRLTLLVLLIRALRGLKVGRLESPVIGHAALLSLE